MNVVLLNYSTGEEIHAGDRVRHRGLFATVIFASDGDTEEVAPGYHDHAGAERGVILCDDDGNVDSIGEPDETLEFLDRG